MPSNSKRNSRAHMSKGKAKKERKRRTHRSIWPILRISLLIFTGVICGIFWWVGYHQKLYNFFYQKTNSVLCILGFKLTQLTVEGRVLTPPNLILRAIDMHQNDPIFKTSLPTIYDNLSRIPWIQTVRVRRALPNQLIVSLKERTPIAIWQHQKLFYYVDETGFSIPIDHAAKQAMGRKYPIFIGESANIHIQTILNSLKKYPEIQKNIKFYHWIRNRRWDLTILPNLLVQLPETEVEEALRVLKNLITHPKFCLKTIALLDLRDPAQTIIKFHPPFKPNPKKKGKTL